MTITVGFLKLIGKQFLWRQAENNDLAGYNNLRKFDVTRGVMERSLGFNQASPGSISLMVFCSIFEDFQNSTNIKDILQLSANDRIYKTSPLKVKVLRYF